jgi:hypothetical protein
LRVKDEWVDDGVKFLARGAPFHGVAEAAAHATLRRLEWTA